MCIVYTYIHIQPGLKGFGKALNIGLTTEGVGPKRSDANPNMELGKSVIVVLIIGLWSSKIRQETD